MVFSKKNKWFLSSLFLLAAMISSAPWGGSLVYGMEKTASDGNIHIYINENSLVNTEQITLGQISRIDANGFLKEALRKIEMGKAPKPGQIKAVTKDKAVSMIQSQQYLPENVVVECPDQVYVKRASQTVLDDDVKQFVIQSLESQYSGKAFKIISFDVRGLAVYPQGTLTFSANSSQMVDKKGRLSFYLDVLVDGDKKDRVNVKGSIAVYTQVLCAAKRIKKGQPVLPEDVEFKEINMFELEKDYLAKFENIGKKIPKSGIKKGAVLTQSLFCEPILVKKGDIVTLIAANDRLRIVTSGICLEDGFENGLIKVENLNSGKMVRGIVKDKSKVEVVY